MFTVEMDFDRGRAVRIYTLDHAGDSDDVQVVLYEDEVYLIQTNEEHNTQDMIIMSPQQFADIITAMGLGEGAYYIGKKR